MLEFASADTEDCTSLEKGLSNDKSQGASGKATVTTRFDAHGDMKVTDSMIDNVRSWFGLDRWTDQLPLATDSTTVTSNL